MENLDFLSSANMTDVLSSDNSSCKWRKRGGGARIPFIFIYGEKYRGKYSMRTCTRKRR